MKITTERAEELASQREHQEDYRCAEAIRALAKERDNLLADGIHSCGPDCQRSGCVNRRLTEQLAAAQAVIAKKDEALEICSAEYNAVWTHGMPILEPILDSALALTPSDDTALREMLAEQLERAAEYVARNLMSCGEYADALRAEAEKLRKTPAQGAAA